jgi:TatD DNase family protein
VIDRAKARSLGDGEDQWFHLRDPALAGFGVVSMIDSHCHLAGPEFDADFDEVVARAQASGLRRCLVILAADDDDELARASRVARAWADVRFSVGVHPHHAHKFADQPERAAAVTAHALDRIPDARAIGEIGLDYHYDFSPRDVQQAVFRAQLQLANDRGLPVVIHTREAEDDTLRIISDEGRGRLRGVFHCFSGSPAAADRALATGFYVSIPGIVTFPKSAELRDSARQIPAERLLIETDSPYLAPVPHRGKRNEPSYVVRVFDTLAGVRGIDRDVLGERLVQNFDDLFAPRGRRG